MSSLLLFFFFEYLFKKFKLVALLLKSQVCPLLRRDDEGGQAGERASGQEGVVG